MLRGVQVDAVQVVARLLGGGGEAGPVDQAAQVLGGKLEAAGELGLGELRELFRRQGGKREGGPPAAQPDAVRAVFGLQLHLRAIGQLAGDVVKHLRRQRGAAARDRIGVHSLHGAQLQVGRREAQPPVRRFEHDIAQNRDGVGPFDHALRMAERFQELAAFDGELHRRSRSGYGIEQRSFVSRSV